MPNIRVKNALAKIDREINRVGQHIVQHSGIDSREALEIENLASDIAQTAAQIVDLCHQAQHTSHRPGSVLKNTRKALGYAYPSGYTPRGYPRL